MVECHYCNGKHGEHYFVDYLNRCSQGLKWLKNWCLIHYYMQALRLMQTTRAIILAQTSLNFMLISLKKQQQQGKKLKPPTVDSTYN